MAKFIEIHKMPACGGDGPVLVLQNLDDISAVFPRPGDTAVIALRNSPYGTAHFEVMESYAHLRLMIGAAQGGIPMDTGGSY